MQVHEKLGVPESEVDALHHKVHIIVAESLHITTNSWDAEQRVVAEVTKHVQEVFGKHEEYEHIVAHCLSVAFSFILSFIGIARETSMVTPPEVVVQFMEETQNVEGATNPPNFIHDLKKAVFIQALKGMMNGELSNLDKVLSDAKG